MPIAICCFCDFYIDANRIVLVPRNGVVELDVFFQAAEQAAGEDIERYAGAHMSRQGSRGGAVDAIFGGERYEGSDSELLELLSR
ncbi:MAG TPA: hypothetical protein VFQ87_10760 [Bradyrhizobium sp.]|jgi:hypothetical protein|nr:hypothetical protein [Bradyrhizobium sp.]